MELRYIGPHDEVDILDGPQGVARNATFEAVGDLANSLLAQADNFERVKASKSTSSKTKTEA